MGPRYLPCREPAGAADVADDDIDTAVRAFLIQKLPLVWISIPITSCALRFKISADMMRRCTACRRAPGLTSRGTDRAIHHQSQTPLLANHHLINYYCARYSTVQHRAVLCCSAPRCLRAQSMGLMRSLRLGSFRVQAHT